MSDVSSFSVGGMIDNVLSSDLKDAYASVEFNELRDMAEFLKKCIVSNAKAQFYGSQLSIFKHVDGISIGDPVNKGNGLYSIDLKLTGDLHRPSLNPSREGAYNIVSLFMHGWKCKRRVPFGKWHDKMVIARAEKSGMSFLEDAVELFNMKYSDRGAVAVISGDFV